MTTESESQFIHSGVIWPLILRCDPGVADGGERFRLFRPSVAGP